PSVATRRPAARAEVAGGAGRTVASDGWATQRLRNGCASSCQAVDTSSTSRVRRLGTIAMSSRWYPRRALFPCPISTKSRTAGLRSAGMIVGGFDGHLDVVRVALLEPRRGDPDELSLALHLGDARR